MKEFSAFERFERRRFSPTFGQRTRGRDPRFSHLDRVREETVPASLPVDRDETTRHFPLSSSLLRSERCKTVSRTRQARVETRNQTTTNLRDLTNNDNARIRGIKNNLSRSILLKSFRSSVALVFYGPGVSRPVSTAEFRSRDSLSCLRPSRARLAASRPQARYVCFAERRIGIFAIFQYSNRFGRTRVVQFRRVSILRVLSRVETSRQIREYGGSAVCSVKPSSCSRQRFTDVRFSSGHVTSRTRYKDSPSQPAKLSRIPIVLCTYSTLLNFVRRDRGSVASETRTPLAFDIAVR